MEGILSLSVCLVARKDALDCRDACLDREKNSPVTDANAKQGRFVSFESLNAYLIVAQPLNRIGNAFAQGDIKPLGFFERARPPFDATLHARSRRMASSCGIEGSSSSPSRSAGSNGSSSIGAFSSRTSSESGSGTISKP